MRAGLWSNGSVLLLGALLSGCGARRPGSPVSEAGGSSGCDGGRCPEACIVRVAAGVFHTCAVKSDGTLWCWGRNDCPDPLYDCNYGAVGDGTTVNRTSPVQVIALGTSVAEVTAGLGTTCATKQDGSLWCWGHNNYGQLGDGTTVDRSTPAQVAMLGAGVVKAATGWATTCAIMQDGTLWCWGDNQYGQLGDGTTADSSTPVQVIALGNAVNAVTLHGWRTCATKQDGTLWCWGMNLTSPKPYSDFIRPSDYSTVPLQVTALGTDVVEATLGDSHYCARKREGSVWCWGSNNYGSLGADPIDNGWTPGRVTALGTGVSAISAGDGHTCAIVMDATLCCWGSNFLGALGNGTTVASSVPVRATVLGNAQVARVSAGGYGYTCAATTDGALWCWGHNEDGQLGDGTTMDSVTAVRPSIPCP